MSTQAHLDSQFRELDRDLWLAQRIRDHTGKLAESIFAGVTTPTQRRERTRQVILENGLSTVILGTHKGKSETYAQFFKRSFGESL